ncbi:uncharacterized protein BDR25DRAFT_394461 [Lindgomyces ingoldianus]|uniref:Uncharacterized protein n=1 Tax=Lindgomyces ingoldianus TaxID=673940 RepID=A0ACB6QQ46_9PLEO|nr:uncharacterized protein BDR25DRAFT_394461 [Lindgomyces ingoldianus]KAF2469036.1 hypothetical protein BDR25DRAFT_394461 [Lindgomyces ingoldianus]
MQLVTPRTTFISTSVFFSEKESNPQASHNVLSASCRCLPVELHLTKPRRLSPIEPLSTSGPTLEAHLFSPPLDSPFPSSHTNSPAVHLSSFMHPPWDEMPAGDQAITLVPAQCRCRYSKGPLGLGGGEAG